MIELGFSSQYLWNRLGKLSLDEQRIESLFAILGEQRSTRVEGEFLRLTEHPVAIADKRGTLDSQGRPSLTREILLTESTTRYWYEAQPTGETRNWEAQSYRDQRSAIDDLVSCLRRDARRVSQQTQLTAKTLWLVQVSQQTLLPEEVCPRIAAFLFIPCQSRLQLGPSLLTPVHLGRGVGSGVCLTQDPLN